MRAMKAILVRLFILALPLSVLAQQIAHEAAVVNIEVPVRVFQGSRFVDTLTLDDFEIEEDGIRQKPLAVYLVRKTAIAKREEPEKGFRPIIDKRHFLLLFELNDYVPELTKAVDDFIGRVMTPADSLMVVTPLKSYNFKEEAYARLPKEKIAARLKSLLKRDIGRASLEYRALLWHIKDIGRLSPEGAPMIIGNATQRLRDMKKLDIQGFMSAADHLKALDGQKFVFLFYQKESIPVPAVDDLEVFEYRTNEGIGFDTIKRVFSDASITTHFVYITKGMADVDTGDRSYSDNILESATPIFRAFRDLTITTGGIVDITANAAAGMKMASEASENYYLLYYAPARYAKDGSFKKIKVTVRGKNLTVFHRAGYIAD